MPPAPPQAAGRPEILGNYESLALERLPDEIPDDCLLFGVSLGLDSVDALEIVVAIKGEFGVRVEEGDMSEIRSSNKLFTSAVAP